MLYSIWFSHGIAVFEGEQKIFDFLVNYSYRVRCSMAIFELFFSQGFHICVVSGASTPVTMLHF